MKTFGYALSIIIIMSVFLLYRELKVGNTRKYKDQILLLALTLGILFLFFQLLPSKGDRFMITLIPPAVILGCSFLALNSVRRWGMYKILCVLMVPLIVLSNNFFLSNVFPIEKMKISDNLGTPWNREVAHWIKKNTSSDSSILVADRKAR